MQTGLLVGKPRRRLGQTLVREVTSYSRVHGACPQFLAMAVVTGNGGAGGFVCLQHNIRACRRFYCARYVVRVLHLLTLVAVANLIGRGEI